MSNFAPHEFHLTIRCVSAEGGKAEARGYDSAGASGVSRSGLIDEAHCIIDASPTGDLAFLVTAYGKPFTAAGFGNRMRGWCDKAGLSDCSTHGLRKAAAARLAELGCAEFEVMAVTGHQTSWEVTRYTKAASQGVRAASALAKMSGGKP